MNSFHFGLDELEEIYKLAIESSHNHTIITDVKGMIIFANSAAERATGYTIQEMQRDTPRLWGRQMQPNFYKKLWQKISEEKTAFKGEVINKRKSGELYTAIVTISPILDRWGALRGFLGVEEDISAIKAYETSLIEKTRTLDETLSHLKEQNVSLESGRKAILNILEDEKELENELKKEKESVEKKVIERTKELSDEKARLTAAISSLPHVFLIVNDTYQLVLSNNRLTPILGKPNGDWTFQKVNDSLGEEFDLREYVSEIIAGKKEIRKREIVVGSKYLKVYGAPIIPNALSEANVSLGAVVTISDVTEERLLARSKDEFFSIASHELRTPLTAIRGNTSMILDYYSKELTNPELKAMIADTHAESIRLISIVNDFLSMSRLEQGKMEYLNEKVRVFEVVQKITADLNYMCAKKKIQLVTAVDKEVIVWADKGRVEQILLNLIGNALKFTIQGTITISSQEEQGVVTIEVSDTGSGISLVNQNLLFRKFQQAGSSTVTRETSQGTGLGLYISRLMAEGMKGTLFLKKSEEGKGSIFCLTLPLASNDIQ